MNNTQNGTSIYLRITNDNFSTLSKTIKFCDRIETIKKNYELNKKDKLYFIYDGEIFPSHKKILDRYKNVFIPIILNINFGLIPVIELSQLHFLKEGFETAIFFNDDYSLENLFTEQYVISNLKNGTIENNYKNILSKSREIIPNEFYLVSNINLIKKYGRIKCQRKSYEYIEHYYDKSKIDEITGTSDSEIISVIIPYYKDILALNSIINSIKKSNLYSYQIVIINNNQKDKLLIKNLREKNFYLNIKVINLKTECNLKYCVKLGIENSNGKILIIQQNDCYHVGDMLMYTYLNCNKKNYIIFPTLKIEITDNERYINNIKNLNDVTDKNVEWLYHSEINKNYDIYGLAIFKKQIQTLINLNEGVDELPNENFYFKIDIIAKYSRFILGKSSPLLVTNVKRPSINQNEIQSIKLNENITSNFKYPKIVHFFWHGPMPFLNFMTLLSFRKYHPNWVINLYLSNNAQTINKWGQGEQKQLKKNKKDYLPSVKKLNYVNIIYIDKLLKELKLDKLYMVHQGEIMKFYSILKFGGVYSDLDIIFTENLEKFFRGETKTILYDRDSSLASNYKYYPAGFFIGNRGCNFCKFIINEQLNYIDKIRSYNGLGPDLIRKIAMDPKYDLFLKKNVKIVDSKCYLPLEWFELKQLYQQKEFSEKIRYFCVHWFNGAAESRDYIDSFDINNFRVICKMDKLISEYIPELKILSI